MVVGAVLGDNLTPFICLFERRAGLITVGHIDIVASATIRLIEAMGRTSAIGFQPRSSDAAPV
jgi:hypothetical protein